MGKKAAVICGAVVLLGVLAAILGFVGEGTKKRSLVRYDGEYCVYRTTPALGCGVTALLFLVTAQVVVSAATACCGCCRTRKASVARRCIAVVLAIVSWTLTIIAALLFFAGAVLNTSRKARSAEGSATATDAKCFVLPTGVFDLASGLSLAVVVLGIISYFLLEGKESPAPAPPAAPGIAMGQPEAWPYFQPQQTAKSGAPANAVNPNA